MAATTGSNVCAEVGGTGNLVNCHILIIDCMRGLLSNRIAH